MTLPTNGITAEVIRDMMPPYQLNTDLLAAMLAAVPPPPRDATMAWRQARCARLVHEVAGLMPANAPQARIAAEIVIVREAAEDTLARAGVAGLAVEQVCRLRRTASALLASVAALERSLVRHQQKPVPFFGTVLADGIDIAAIAAGWGGAGPRDFGGEASGGVASDAAMAAKSIMAEEAGGDDAAAPCSDGGFADEPVRLAPAGSRPGRGTPGQGFPALVTSSDPAVAAEARPAMPVEASPVSAASAAGTAASQAGRRGARRRGDAAGPRAWLDAGCRAPRLGRPASRRAK